MILPPPGVWAFMIRTAWWAHRKAPLRLVSTTCRQSAHEISSTEPTGPNTPALLTSRSTRPHRRWTAPNSAATDSGTVMSVGAAGPPSGGRPAGGPPLGRRRRGAPARRALPPGRERGPGDAPAEPRPRAGHHSHTGGCHVRPPRGRPAAPRPAASAQVTLTGGRPPPAPRAGQRSIRWPGGEPRMSQRTDADIGVPGLGAMGRNLARNLARPGHVVALHNRSPERTRSLVAEHGDEGTFAPSESMEDFAASLRRPRAIVVMVKAGAGTDAVIDELVPLLDEGDVV